MRIKASGIVASLGKRGIVFVRTEKRHRVQVPYMLSTPRLRLRLWRDDDLPAFAAMNADPKVMEFLPKSLDRDESHALADRLQAHFARHGFGFWAVEVPGIADFIGFIGLSVSSFDAHFTPCVEAGWRLAHKYWGQGYATDISSIA